MNQPFFTGVCTALVTPFLNGEVNYPMTEILLRRQIEAGVTNIVLAGTTGESPTLSDSEKIELFKRCKNYVGDQCNIIAGTGSNNTGHAVALSTATEQTGADALLIVSPYYNKATSEGLFLHYKAIAESVSVPIIIYNVPSRTGVDIPVSVYEKLSRIPNIVGVKEASNDITKISRIRSVCSPEFSVWTGNDDQIIPAIAQGCEGVISVLSNIYPKETSAICKLMKCGNMEAASALHRSLMPLIDLLFSEVNPIPVKYAMKCIGYDCGGCRLPLTFPSAAIQEKISKIL